jgi:hypothetical protein
MAAFMNRLGDVVFEQGGSAFGAPAILGTRDAQPLDIRVDDSRVMRYEPNTISPNVIGGSPANGVMPGVRGATIAGGGMPAGDSDPTFDLDAPNVVTDAYGTVGGGFGNQAGDDAGTTEDAGFATVAGGAGNAAYGLGSAVGGGQHNFAAGSQSTVGGGSENSAGAGWSTVSGGFHNSAGGSYSTAAGGVDNLAGTFASTVSGGASNIATGLYSTVAGGRNNTAAGAYSFAAGRNARAQTTGSFVWADSREPVFTFPDSNFFGVRATGGVNFTIAINASGGGLEFCRLQPGITGWICVSDREHKENLEPARGEAMLDKLGAMPVYSWNYKGADPALRNVGPTAQDFHAAFGLGTDDKTIAGNNLLGVAVAAIQGLNAKLDAKIAERDARIAAQADEIASLRRSLASLLAGRTAAGRGSRVR